MTALAILGSATRTSLTSCGRSTTTDLLTPRGTKFDPNSEATTFTPETGAGSGARCPAAANSIAPKTRVAWQTNKVAARQSVQFAIADVLFALLHFGIVVVVTPNRTMFMRFDAPESSDDVSGGRLVRSESTMLR